MGIQRWIFEKIDYFPGPFYDDGLIMRKSNKFWTLCRDDPKEAIEQVPTKFLESFDTNLHFTIIGLFCRNKSNSFFCWLVNLWVISASQTSANFCSSFEMENQFSPPRPLLLLFIAPHCRSSVSARRPRNGRSSIKIIPLRWSTCARCNCGRNFYGTDHDLIPPSQPPEQTSQEDRCGEDVSAHPQLECLQFPSKLHLSSFRIPT